VCGWFVCSIFLKWSAISIRLKGSYRINFDIAREIFSIGLPSAMEQFVVQGGLMMFARTVSSLGTVTFAAHQIGLSICGLTFSPSMAFGVAGTTLVGQSLGANDEERAKRYADIIHHMAIAVACFMGLMFILFSYPWPVCIQKTLKLPQWPVLCLNNGFGPARTIDAAFPCRCAQGAGDTMFPLYSSIAGIWVFVW